MINQSKKIGNCLFYSPITLENDKYQLFNRINGKHFKVGKAVINFLEGYYSSKKDSTTLSEEQKYVIHRLTNLGILTFNAPSNSLFKKMIYDYCPVNLNFSFQSLKKINFIWNIIVLITFLTSIVLLSLNFNHVQKNFIFPNIHNIFLYLIFGYLINFLGTILHEGSHFLSALVNKVYVPRIGLMIYYFSFAGFVDITGVRFTNNNVLAKVSLSGSKANIFLGSLGIVLLIIINAKSYFLSVLIIISVLTLLSNMNIFLKLDGYYALESLLDETFIREKSISLIGHLSKNNLQDFKTVTLTIMGILSVITVLCTFLLLFSVILNSFGITI
ncbi:hypothetical protein [Fructobacillus evanidus]|uniref:Zn-dependent protease (Includes sporulation protein SpoIVFB) (SpoIVFB) n=1 Tax=Fructobacillus evanidus TaxID=3064281 RepID=A0ABN9YVQ4_9LACO|nr:Zn-dependent protease (includes sporulation protein SpoIVFB) (SpoIVFB) [Fructobacillus sp. LMG 32999]CAK1247559.1 Zn-dependent protease (includes sporulation protein SpoIVFB) (SpoIVFB) [Fructobacillus sp. LMG 32999]CAK1248384.1 Zn-dependent protease (includes sporulation protein SpoIVFB) (SpoIVFB) [Fructobacillus sp. LMG 32999]CAK1248794.1 Zn-dependent protease (includes sporulation protein SpoIVFB) (SpoIVFB) [Fructobacillus sp. LMG 32999]CAK1254127.1 Zn-dependent protease (includes sporulat